MGASHYDVVVVGGGCAGMSAALGLAKAGFSVVVLEAAAYPGAENWSGCVYFCENLAHPSLLGPDGVEALAWERRLVERGTFVSNGHSLLGMTYRDPEAFRHCYTVLRPIFDHHLAQLAMQAGVVILNNTTAESLIRDGGRIVGVATNRGPVYADLTFLAEGDASHLVTREGYERTNGSQRRPSFLHGIKQVIDLPAGAIEENFGLGHDQGAAYEIILRNGTLRGQTVRLNMGGFVYTNRQSLSIGLVLPADNLHEHFGGDPNLLVEWFENLPDIQRWSKSGSRGVFGAKVIRGGGARDIPHLIDNGLAIGGAATGIGVDFPYPNFTGPATRMGLQIVEAAKAVRRTGGSFNQDELRQHYLEPLRQTRYWKDVEYLRRWPGYVERTQFFFGRNLDLALGTAYVWTRPKKWLPTKWLNWVQMLLHLAGPGRWREMRQDLAQLSGALRLREVAGKPALGRLLLDGMVNTLRDLFGTARKDVPSAGQLHFVYSVAGGAEPVGPPPKTVRRWFRRFAPVLAAAARTVYANDDTPLRDKLRTSIHLLIQQVNLLDSAAAFLGAVACTATAGLLTGWNWFKGTLRRLVPIRTRPEKLLKRFFPRYLLATRQAGDLTPLVPQAAQKWEDRLGQLSYETDKHSHIHLLWPKQLEREQEIAKAGLWNVCPAHVYEARVSPLGQLQVVVNHENCIKCETCWRVSDLVDWGRDGRQRFVYPVGSPAADRLLAAQSDAAGVRQALPRALDWWEPITQALEQQARAVRHTNGHDDSELLLLRQTIHKFDRKLTEFDGALGEEPRTVDGARSAYLEMLARYAQQLAELLVAQLRQSVLGAGSNPLHQEVHKHLLQLAPVAAAKIGEMVRHAGQQKFSWAAADARHVRQHHLEGLRRILQVLTRHVPPTTPMDDPCQDWLWAERSREQIGPVIDTWVRQLDEVFSPGAWRDLEQGAPLTSAQDETLRSLVAEIPPIDTRTSLHSRLRKALLAELGRRDPSLAYRAASHLWARDLAPPSPALGAGMTRPQGAGLGGWSAFAVVEGGSITDGRCYGEVLFVPEAEHTLLLIDNHLIELPAEAAGLKCEPLATLGLRGAGLRRIVLDGMALPETSVAVNRDELLRTWQALSAADLTSIAFGMADVLTKRSVAHATSRVQFPGLFQDEQSRDTIGKFGAVKKMIAEMGARRYLLETLDQNLSPADFSPAAVDRSVLVKALVAELLGTAPGSISYNAGQIFGGTGYSEDDILAKFYRDAAAWRFLGPTNVAVWQDHGRRLVEDWRDGQSLAWLKDESELFDQVAQRKAFQAELDELRVMRTRLRLLVSRHASANPARFAELLARQDAHQLAGKAILFRTHARMEEGLPAEESMALVRVWFDCVGRALHELDDELRNPLTPNPSPTEGGGGPSTPSAPPSPLVGEGGRGGEGDYAKFLAYAAPYRSGDFLCRPVDLRQPRFVPEMLQSDPELAETDRRFRYLLANHFGPRDGLPFERYIERQHRPDAKDLDFCRRHGFFRMMVPKELGGELGDERRRKVDYYLLTTNAQRLVDVSISLTIQASSSIGTTPILLARDKDLPKARKELAPFIGDDSLQKEIQKRIEKVLRLLDFPEPKRIQPAFQDLHKRLDETVFSRAVLKSLAHRFAETWLKAARAGQEHDLPRFRALLKEALSAWTEACARAPEHYEELARRQEACDLALRWIASGQISAFALTEPSAGSDTARVATRARLRSVPVEVLTDGVFRFIPAGAEEARYLLDARRLEFRPEGVFYRWSPAAEPSRIRFDEYDYETDDSRKARYYDCGGKRVYFTDIAQLRARAGRLWYDYWELTGAKMWITNGRMAGIMSLYAKTTEGVTGFMVDRHAEGLIVGKDEAKMGQCGSPTNEVSLERVRVPREHVLGLEGRGQVNALETLNVGRAGLAMSAVALMPSMLEDCRWSIAEEKRINHRPSTIDHAHRLERMEEARFAAEALAFEVIGRFEHKQTQSVRMESAIAKMMVSELLHSMIELGEEVHGLAGQTQLHLIEKRKRDARILNIYEGTNEVQRFLILKELVEEVLPRWQAPAATSTLADPVSAQLQSMLNGFRSRLEEAVHMFGPSLWQNPNLQANCFLLSEAAAWLKTMDSVAGRMVWLAARGADTGLAQRTLARCASEVRQRLRRFDQELVRLRRGHYASEVRAAGLMLDRFDPGTETPRTLRSESAKPLSVLVVLEPTAANVPRPRVRAGKLLESHVTLSDADRSALETALRLRDQAGERVTIKVATVGQRTLIPLLREILSLGVDQALLVLSPVDAVPPEQAAEALGRTLRRRGERFDLILGGAGPGGSEAGLAALLTARVLEVPHIGSCRALAIRHTEEEQTLLLMPSDQRQQKARALPAAVNIEAGVSLRAFTTRDYFRTLSRSVDLERWPRGVPAEGVLWLPAARAAEHRTQAPTGPLAAPEAAHLFLDELGLKTGELGEQAAAPEPVFIEDVGHPEVLEESGALAVIGCDATGRLSSSAVAAVRSAEASGAARHRKAAILMLAPNDEAGQQRALTQLKSAGPSAVAILVHPEAATASNEVRARLLLECWPALASSPEVILGESWTESAFAALRAKSDRAGELALRIQRAAVVGAFLRLETVRGKGSLRTLRVLQFSPGATHWITLTDDAEAAPLAEAVAPSLIAQRWTPRLERFFGQRELQRLLDELKEETGLVRLADAEFVIDVGFGVGNRDGYEQVIMPLEQALRDLGVRGLMIGGSRKVTEELHLLPSDRQIGQSGQHVNPWILLAIGISGAPQHLNYIGPRATIISFNRDPEAPLMTLNQRQPRPRVYPVVGDLFETVPAFIAALRSQESGVRGQESGVRGQGSEIPDS